MVSLRPRRPPIPAPRRVRLFSGRAAIPGWRGTLLKRTPRCMMIGPTPDRHADIRQRFAHLTRAATCLGAHVSARLPRSLAGWRWRFARGGWCGAERPCAAPGQHERPRGKRKTRPREGRAPASRPGDGGKDPEAGPAQAPAWLWNRATHPIPRATTPGARKTPVASPTSVIRSRPRTHNTFSQGRKTPCPSPRSRRRPCLTLVRWPMRLGTSRTVACKRRLSVPKLHPSRSYVTPGEC